MTKDEFRWRTPSTDTEYARMMFQVVRSSENAMVSDGFLRHSESPGERNIIMRRCLYV